MKSKFKIFFSVVLLAVVLFAAVPKIYIHSLLGHIHNTIHSTSDDVSVSEKETIQNCNFEKFDTSVYYTVFKFVLNFIPVRELKQTSFYYKQKLIQKHPYYISPLRGPPIA